MFRIADGGGLPSCRSIPPPRTSPDNPHPGQTRVQGIPSSLENAVVAKKLARLGTSRTFTWLGHGSWYFGCRKESGGEERYREHQGPVEADDRKNVV